MTRQPWPDSSEQTATTWPPRQLPKWIAMTRWPPQDSHDRPSHGTTVMTGQLQQECHDRTAKTGQMGPFPKISDF
jgi:hypothetical protein